MYTNTYMMFYDVTIHFFNVEVIPSVGRLLGVGGGGGREAR